MKRLFLFLFVPYIALSFGCSKTSKDTTETKHQTSKGYDFTASEKQACKLAEKIYYEKVPGGLVGENMGYFSWLNCKYLKGEKAVYVIGMKTSNSPANNSKWASDWLSVSSISVYAITEADLKAPSEAETILVLVSTLDLNYAFLFKYDMKTARKCVKGKEYSDKVLICLLKKALDKEYLRESLQKTY